MIITKIVILTIILVASFIMIVKKMKTDIIIKYLSFVLLISFFVFRLFYLESALWVMLICAIGLILNMKLTFIKKTILIFI